MAILEPVVDYLSKKRDLTYWEYTLLPNDGKRYEILEGELFMTPSPKTKHQVVSRNLLVAISIFLRNSSNIGKVFSAPYDVILSPSNVVEPDVIFISNENSDIITEDNIQGSPDLLVEIVSPSTERNDREKKKAVYEKFGVKEYWIVDPEKEEVEIYTLVQNKYRLFDCINKESTLSSSVINGFSIEAKQLFID